MHPATKELIFELIKIVLVLAFVVAILLIANPHWVMGAHWQGDTKEWRSDYKGRNGGSCCGEEDCWIAAVRVIQMGDIEETSIIEVDGMIISDFPTGGIHVSQDQNSYACHPYYGAHEPGDVMKDAKDNIVAPGIEQCNKNTKNPNCINCVFITGGA